MPPDDVRLGAYYDVTKLPDYGGDVFRHKSAKLVQLDVRDVHTTHICIIEDLCVRHYITTRSHILFITGRRTWTSG